QGSEHPRGGRGGPRGVRGTDGRLGARVRGAGEGVRRARRVVGGGGDPARRGPRRGLIAGALHRGDGGSDQASVPTGAERRRPGVEDLVGQGEEVSQVSREATAERGG